MPSARNRGPLGTLLLAHLDALNGSQAELARALGVLTPQIATWFTGEEAIPPKHLWRLAELLHFGPSEATELFHISEATARHRELIRLFIESERRRKPSVKRAGPDLASHFKDPEDILKRYVAFSETLMAKDAAIYPPVAAARIVHIHLDAAHRSAHDLDAFLSSDDRNLFSDRNIGPHLSHPHHYYISFFLTELTACDGAHVPELQRKIVEAFEACVDLRKAETGPDLQVAQHALHMLARYRGDPIAPFAEDPNPETRRMVYFGEVYREYDDGPFEKLSQLIAFDEDFGEATFRFDATHYRDSGVGADAPLVPLNSMTRYLVGLGDARVSMRTIACARLLNLLRRFGASEPMIRKQIAAKRALIEGFKPENRAQSKVAGELLAIADKAKRGEPE